MVESSFKNRARVKEKHKFKPHDIYNLGETGCNTVQNPANVVVLNSE